VTISRGRKRVTVFTEDKAALRAAVVRQGGKDLALDLLPRPAGADAQDERNARSLLEQVRRHRVVVDRDTGNRARIRIAL
jgi:hypothetical protein